MRRLAALDRKSKFAKFINLGNFVVLTANPSQSGCGAWSGHRGC
jgi:hypothetical protein